MNPVLAFIFGLLAGSFLNVCIHRWPRQQSVTLPRSYCPHCNHLITWYDNIPLFSYLWLKQHCRHCSQRISIRYPIVELLNATLYLLFALSYGTSPIAFKTAIFTSMMLILFFTDLEHFILPDQVTLGGLVIGVALSSFVPLPKGLADIGLLLLNYSLEERWISPLESILSAVLFGGIMYLTGEIFYKVRGIQGLGLGDVKMVAMIAAFWGTSQVLLVLLAGSVLALFAGMMLILFKGETWQSRLPFGSFLAVAAVGSIFSTDVIVQRYWEFMLG